MNFVTPKQDMRTWPLGRLLGSMLQTDMATGNRIAAYFGDDPKAVADANVSDLTILEGVRLSEAFAHSAATEFAIRLYQARWSEQSDQEGVKYLDDKQIEALRKVVVEAFKAGVAAVNEAYSLSAKPDVQDHMIGNEYLERFYLHFDRLNSTSEGAGNRHGDERW